jgi:hypothetical protein
MLTDPNRKHGGRLIVRSGGKRTGNMLLSMGKTRCKRYGAIRLERAAKSVARRTLLSWTYTIGTPQPRDLQLGGDVVGAYKTF